MSVHDRDKTGKTRIRCSTARESGTCGHSRLYYLEAVEQVVLEGLREELGDPRLIAEFVAAYQAERAPGARGGRPTLADRAPARRGVLERLVDALAQGLAAAGAVRDRILALEDKKASLQEELAATPEPANVVALLPVAVARYLEAIDQMAQQGAGSFDVASQTSFRELVESVVVEPTEPRQPVRVTLVGWLATLMQEPRLRPSGTHSGFAVVAEEGLEPPTQGL